MAYNLGQLLRSSISNYSISVSYSKETALNSTTIIDFYDPCLTFSGTYILSSLYSYYLKFTVAGREDSLQTITVKLRQSELEDDNEQDIKSVVVKQNTDSATFEMIIHPNGTYNQLIFELSRLALDFNLENEDGTSGRFVDITIDDFYIVNNIITTLSNTYSGLTTLTKIGIQGPPGLIFTIDGEEIRIGRSGIYELYNSDIEISYLGFIIKESTFTQDGKDFFILDFKY